MRRSMLAVPSYDRGKTGSIGN
eukprot:COSAG01_NODE_43310_length_431_cov_0.626506_1_plen_21_part_10